MCSRSVTYDATLSALGWSASVGKCGVDRGKGTKMIRRKAKDVGWVVWWTSLVTLPLWSVAYLRKSNPPGNRGHQSTDDIHPTLRHFPPL